MDKIVAFVSENWVQITVLVVAFHTFLKAVRDAIDKTPETDDNIFEKAVTIIGRVVAYIATGKRA